MQKPSSKMAHLGDEELVVMAQGGDDTAFAELIQRHHSSNFKLALSILRDWQDAEDEVQNASWKAFQHINQFQRDAKFTTWMTRIVVNQCLMRIRQSRRANLFYLEDAKIGEEQGALELRDGRQTPEEELGEKEVSTVLTSEIRRIPPLLRSVFLLREIEQLPMPDVARRLGISVAAAKSRLLRARIELRARLARHQGHLGHATLLA